MEKTQHHFGYGVRPFRNATICVITGTEQVIDGGSTLPETFDILHA